MFIKEKMIIALYIMILLMAGCGMNGHDKEVIQENLQEEKDAERKKAAEESSEEYKASFLGVDSSVIQACQVYYGERQEEIDMSEARGKYLVQMLSGFLENPDYSFMYTSGMLDLNDKGLEELAKINKGNYFVCLQFGQEVPFVFPEKKDVWTTHMRTENLRAVIIKIGKNTLTLNRQAGEGLYYPLVCQDPKMEAGFLEKCKEWDQTESWTEAFEKLEESQAEQKAGRAEMLQLISRTDTGQEGEDGKTGQVHFLGTKGCQVKACRIYHGGSQQELDLLESDGQAFIQEFSAFLLGNRYSDEDMGYLDGESLENLENVAKENGEDYYILFQFEHPLTIVLNGQPEGAFWIHDIDTLVVEVDLDEKILNLNWHNQKELPNDGFFSCIGVHNKKAANDFVAMYEEWGSL